MASKTPSQAKRKIADITKPDVAADVKTPQIVIENRARIQSPAEESTPVSETKSEESQAAPHITSTAKSITPPETENANTAETPEPEQAGPVEKTEPKPVEEPKPASPASNASNIANSSDGALDSDPTEKSEAVKDAEAKRQDEVEAKRQSQLNQYIDTKEFFVPINAAARKRSIEVSLWLTLVYIILSVILIDLMLDSGMIELLQKVPHTNFFST